MKTAKVILLAVVGLLLFADVSWRIWTWKANVAYRAATRRIQLIDYHTNNVEGVGILEAKTGKLLWIEWFDNGEKIPSEVSSYFDGANVFNLFPKENETLRYEAIFHGLGKSQTSWHDLGRGLFMDRFFWDTNGVFSKMEIWYDNTWHTVDRRNERNGILINGQWCQLAFDTNRMWTIETKTNQ
jgi:hypothetical protein